jgi:hypothetical protein
MTRPARVLFHLRAIRMASMLRNSLTCSFACLLALLVGCSDPQEVADRDAATGESDPGGEGGAGGAGDGDGDGDADPALDPCVSANPCDDDASCTNAEGVAVCACDDGYEGDGEGCEDVDECASGSPCGDNASCRNNVGGFDCDCDPLYGDVDGTCTPLCEIALADAEICDSEAGVCEIIEGEAGCRRCAPDHLPNEAGSGESCSFDQMCADLKCHGNASCALDGATRECDCPSGYEGDGKNSCDNID